MASGGDPRSSEDLLDAISASADQVVSLARAPPGGSPAGVLLSQFAPLLERVPPILRQLLSHEPDEAAALPRSAAESIAARLGRVRALADNAGSSGMVPALAARFVEGAARDLGRFLGLVLLASSDAPAEVREAASALQRELMAARFDPPVPSPSTTTTPQRWQLPTKPDGVVLDLEDVVVRIKTGGEEEELGAALEDLGGIISGGMVWEDGGSIVAVLMNRLGSAKKGNRVRIILLLRSLASQSEGNKEKMADVGSLSIIMRSLIRDTEESREAVGLLMDLSDIPRVCQRMGKVQGCIVMLVALVKGDDHRASTDARKLLDALSSNTQNVLLMAEAGYFKPVVQYLKRGSDMNKILMATAISRIGLTEQMNTALGDEGSIEPLMKMFTSGKLEAKLSALTAIQKLCALKENVERLINSGIIAPLLQILFSVTSVVMTLREPAAAILARLAESELILENKYVVQQIFSLLNLSCPMIQYHLLQALSSMAGHPGAFKMRVKMKENGALQLILPFLTENNVKIRCIALKLLFSLSQDFCEDFTEQLGEVHLNVIANIIATSKCPNEQAAACGILSNIPISDKKTTDVLRRANLLPIIISLLEESVATSSTPASRLLLERVSGVLLRFTVPWDKKLQRMSAELGSIPLLVKLLLNSPPIAKSRAAASLAQLSHNSLALGKMKTSRWMCVPPSEASCEVHSCRCNTRSTFCIARAGAVSPLIQILEGKEREADEAVLEALSTLMQDEIWEKGSHVIEKNSGVQAIIRILEVGNLKAQERAVWMLEKIFQVEDNRGKYGPAAQVLLVDLAQKGDPSLKPMVAKILAHLELLPVQSSYF
uniref:Putative U-box domain-containing protein 42 n=1 Tax=Anthurium amnicola TaxID=1678845 RepID=A0A1D1XE42_9ARAE